MAGTESLVMTHSVIRKPLIYLDNNVVSDLAKKSLSGADIFRLCDCESAYFAFSEYSVSEAIKGDKAEHIAARALVIDTLARVWIPDHLWQRDLGFIRFLTSEVDDTVTEIPLFDSFAGLLVHNPRPKQLTIPANHSAAHEACVKISGKYDESILEKSMEHIEFVRKELKKVEHDVPNMQINLIIAKSVLERYQIPVADSAALICKVAMGGESLNRICPALEIESLLGEFRASDELKADPSNSYDHFHLAACLPICDFFVSSDKDAIKAVEFVKKRSQHAIAKAVRPVLWD